MGTIVHYLIFLIQIYIYIVLAGVVAQWMQLKDTNPVVRFVFRVTNPVYEKMGKIVPLRFGSIDLTPAVWFLLLVIIQRWLERIEIGL